MQPVPSLSVTAAGTRRSVATWARLLLVAGLAVLPGCVSLSSGGIYPEGRNRVFVAFFDNETFYRDVQFLLTDQVVAEVLSRPGLHLTTKQDAEVLLTGRVLNVHQAVLSEDPNQVVTQSATSITVSIDIHDAFTGELIKTAVLTGRGQFVPALGQDLESAQREAYVFLARDIVRQLEAEF